MPGKRQFFLHGKDADSSAGILAGGLAGKNERRLREVSFAGDGLHLLSGKASSVENDGERIAAQSAIGENVNLHQGKFMRDRHKRILKAGNGMAKFAGHPGRGSRPCKRGARPRTASEGTPGADLLPGARGALAVP